MDSDFAPPPADPPAQDDPAHPEHPEHPDHPLGGPPGQLKKPVLGESVVVAPSFGQVMVKLPGAKHWIALEEGSSLPVGSLVKAVKGTVVLTSALEGAATQTGTFWGGIFQVRQSSNGNGRTDLVLRGGHLGRCRAGARGGTPRARQPPAPARPPALGEGRQRPLPHPRPRQRRDHARNDVADRRSLQGHLDSRPRGAGARPPPP